MPYIEQQKREDLNSILPTTAGELNFLIHSIVNEYFSMKDESYQAYNDIIGAIECAKLEIYRRKVTPYEEQKLKQNGDIPFYENSYSGM